MFTSINKYFAKQQLSMSETLSYGLGHFAIAIGGMGSAMYLSFFWTDIAMIPLAAVSMIMLFSRIFDGINDIFIAWLVDRTDTKYGKARPWILRFFIPATIVNLALFYSPDSSIFVKTLWAVITYNLVNLFFSTCCMIPIHSLTSLITPDQKGRVTLNLAGQIAIVSAQVLVSLTFVSGVALFGGGEMGYFSYFAICAVIAGISMFLNFLGTKEKVQPIAKAEKVSFLTSLKTIGHNKWWLLAMGSQFFLFVLMTLQSVTIYYVTYIVNDLSVLTVITGVMFASQLIVPFVFSPFVKKFGKAHATNIALFIAAVGYLLPIFNLTSISLLIFASILKGVGLSGMSCTRFAIMADVVDYGEWKTNQRSDAIVFSGSSITAKVGMGLSSMMITLILAATGYVGAAIEQTSSALSSIVFMFTWMNVIFVAIMMICMFALNGLEAQIPEMQKELNIRKNITMPREN
ncbi:MAG: MFS transporter [Eubacteriales bacterium]